MKVLILGGGGREHALAWKVKKSQQVSWVGCAPGNGGTPTVAENVSLDIYDPEDVVRYARDNNVDLTVVGPEAPLMRGVADAFEGMQQKVFGPVRDAARLEGSKRFAKEVMVSAGVPTSGYRGFTDADEALRYVRRQHRPIVVKASGLAAGKGVFVCENNEHAEEAVRTIMIDKAYGAGGNEIIIEDRLTGMEASLLAICDGDNHLLLPPSRDHKRLKEGDRGPNTGGMGAIAPNPSLDDDTLQWCSENIIDPILLEMKADGTPYKGVLYVGLMLTYDGPQVLEFNVRFGDPEAQVVLPLVDVDLVDLMMHAIDGTLGQFMATEGLSSTDWRRISLNAHASTIVLASDGYPGSYEKGKTISGFPEEQDDRCVFHAGTRAHDGMVVTSGGRVLNATAIGDTLEDSLQKAYDLAEEISFDGKIFRHDIGGFAGYPPR